MSSLQVLSHTIGSSSQASFPDGLSSEIKKEEVTSEGAFYDDREEYTDALPTEEQSLGKKKKFSHRFAALFSFGGRKAPKKKKHPLLSLGKWKSLGTEPTSILSDVLRNNRPRASISYDDYAEATPSKSDHETKRAIDRFTHRLGPLMSIYRTPKAEKKDISSSPSVAIPRKSNFSQEEDIESLISQLPSLVLDDIVSLPSPAQQPSSPRNSTSSITLAIQHVSANHHIVSPSNSTAYLYNEHRPSLTLPSNNIPTLSVSPSISVESNKIPSLSEFPMLGDLEESDSSDSASETQNHILPTPFSQNHSNHNNNRVHQLSSSSLSSEIIDEDLLYKRIWKYQIEKLVGSGAFSKVYCGTNIMTGERYAIKTICKQAMRSDARVRSSIEREVEVLKFLDHPNIVKLEATMETQHYLCIVLQYVEDGELFDYIQAMHQKLAQKDQKVDEALIKNLFLQLVHVVGWMHEHNLIHRDLKLENILIQMVDGHPHLMVADFGLARVVEPGGPKLTTRCGSDEYAAPEIVQSLPYDGRETDTWALGVILYAMLVGYLPFMYQNERGGKLSHLFHRIIRAEVKWPVVADPTKDISPQAKDVVHRILVRRPEKRIRLQDIDQLPWFTDPAQ